MKKVLVLCTGNSCRSQMAESLLSYFSANTKVYSAGTKPEKVNPFAIKAMAEMGIDISKNTSNHADEYANIDFDYVSNPEFLREGSAVKDFLWPDRVIIGTNNEKALQIMRDIYRPLYINKNPIQRTAVETSEMIKYASNSFLALKISFINEIANLCESVGADVHDVAIAMGKDGRISDKFLHPGPGFGGSCFPKDVQALDYTSDEYGYNFSILKSVMEVNDRQKLSIVAKMDKHYGNDVKGKTFGIWGNTEKDSFWETFPKIVSWAPCSPGLLIP